MRTMCVVLFVSVASLVVFLGANSPGGAAFAQDVIVPPKDEPAAPKNETPAAPPVEEQAPKEKEPAPEGIPSEEKAKGTGGDAQLFKDLKDLMATPPPSTGSAEGDRKAMIEVLTKGGALCDEFLQKFPKGPDAPEVTFDSAWLASQLFAYTRLPEYRDRTLKVSAELIANFPQDHEACNAHQLRMQVFRGTSGYADAIAEANAIITQFPKDDYAPEAQYVIYDIYRKLKDPTKAGAALKSLADKFPDSPRGKQARGMLNRSQLVGTTIDIEFKSADGKTMKLSDLRGKVVLVTYWAGFNASSIDLQKGQFRGLYDRYSPEGFTIIAVNVDLRKASFQEALDKLGTPWVQCFDEKGFLSPMATCVGVSAVPSSVLVDRQGKIYGLDLELGKETLRQAIVDLIVKK